MPALSEAAKAELKTLIRIGSPIVIAQVLIMSMNFVDTVMVGRYSAEALGAVAIGGAASLPLVVLGLGITMAINPVVAHYLGARELDKIGKSLRQVLWLSVMLSIPFFLLIRNTEPLLRAMSISDAILPITLEYLDAYSWGILPIFGYVAIRFFNEGLSVTKPAMYISLLGLGLNVVLNYLFIYGYMGFPELGAEGCGYATSIVSLVMLIVMLIFLYNFQPYRRFHIFSRISWPDAHYLGELVRVGVPIGLTSAMEVSLFAAVSLMMGSLGTIQIAAHQVAINVASLAFMIPFGISMAVSSRVGQAKGAGSLERARFRGVMGIALCAGTMVITASLFALFPRAIAAIYSNSEEVISMATGFLYMAALFQLSDGLQVGGYGALRGLKDTKIPMYVNLFSYMIVGLPLAWYLGLHTDVGPIGLWIGLIAGLTLAAIFHTARFHTLTKP